MSAGFLYTIKLIAENNVGSALNTLRTSEKKTYKKQLSTALPCSK